MKKILMKFRFVGLISICIMAMFSNVVKAEELKAPMQYVGDVYNEYEVKQQLKTQEFEEEYASYAAEVSGDFKYEVEADGTATITKYTGTAEVVTIPAKLAGYTVKRVGKFAINNDSVTSVIVSEGITTLAQNWVVDCKNLISVTIPSTVKLLTDDYSARSKGGGKVSACPKFKTFIVSDKNPNLTVINGDLYSKDKKIFYQHPQGIGKTKVEIISGVTTIASYAFESDNIVQEVVMPDSVVTIGDCAFYLSGLTKVKIPKNCKTIGENAFYLTNIKSVHLPAATAEVNVNSFTGNSFETITVDSANKVFTVKNNCLYNKTTDTVVVYPCANPATKLTIPKGTKIIGKDACSNMVYVKEVVIPNTVKEIQYEAFYGAQELTEITIPASVEKIDNMAISCSKKLRKITFQGNAPEIITNAFWLVNAKAYYPKGIKSWTEDKMKLYGAESLTWEPYELKVATPEKPYKIVNVVDGVHVYWKEAENAAKYVLIRIASGLKDSFLETSNTHYTDKNTESGAHCTYYVGSLTLDDSIAGISDSVSITYVDTPDITGRANKSSGIQIGWNKVYGATGYAIYRKSYSGNDAWVRVKTITGNNTFSWIDNSVKSENGKVYKYTVRALAGSDRSILSGCRNTGRTMVRLTTKNLSSADKASATSIKCAWETTSAANGYEVRFMVGSSVYKTFTVGNYKTGVKTFTGLESGKTYKIQVRTYKKVSGVGTFYSAWSEAKYVKL